MNIFTAFFHALNNILEAVFQPRQAPARAPAPIPKPAPVPAPAPVPPPVIVAPVPAPVRVGRGLKMREATRKLLGARTMYRLETPGLTREQIAALDYDILVIEWYIMWSLPGNAADMRWIAAERRKRGKLTYLYINPFRARPDDSRKSGKPFAGEICADGASYLKGRDSGYPAWFVDTDTAGGQAMTVLQLEQAFIEFEMDGVWIDDMATHWPRFGGPIQNPGATLENIKATDRCIAFVRRWLDVRGLDRGMVGNTDWVLVNVALGRDERMSGERSSYTTTARLSILENLDGCTREGVVRLENGAYDAMRDRLETDAFDALQEFFGRGQDAERMTSNLDYPTSQGQCDEFMAHIRTLGYTVLGISWGANFFKL